MCQLHSGALQETARPQDFAQNYKVIGMRQPPEASLNARIHGRGDSGLTLAITMIAFAASIIQGSDGGIKPTTTAILRGDENPHHVLCFHRCRARMRSPAELDDKMGAI
jgi:hypothetical protein